MKKKDETRKRKIPYVRRAKCMHGRVYIIHGSWVYRTSRAPKVAKRRASPAEVCFFVTQCFVESSYVWLQRFFFLDHPPDYSGELR